MKTKDAANKKMQIGILSIAAGIIYVVIYLYINRERFLAGVMDGLRDFL